MILKGLTSHYKTLKGLIFAAKKPLFGRKMGRIALLLAGLLLTTASWAGNYYDGVDEETSYEGPDVCAKHLDTDKEKKDQNEDNGDTDPESRQFKTREDWSYSTNPN
jgi:hypothetical protein